MGGKRRKGHDGLTLLKPIAGGSCHPVHIEGAPLPSVSPEEVEHNWEVFKKADKVDKRAIDRHHKFALGEEPDYDEPESGVVYQKIKWGGDPKEPDQRDLLSGGPESEVPCERCGEMMRIAGEMSRWDVMTQSGEGIDVRLVNIEDISESRRKELQNEFIVILVCPRCYMKMQWAKEFLPKRKGEIDE